MIYHGTRFTLREDVSPGQITEVLELMWTQGWQIPSVQSFVVGQDLGGDFGWGAVYVFEDLAAYRAYLDHPAHAEAERAAERLLAEIEVYDITDDLDPGLAAELAALRQRHLSSAAVDAPKPSRGAAP